MSENIASSAPEAELETPPSDTRRWVGLLAIPPVAAFLLFGPLPASLTTDMRAVAALTATMALLWISEAVPLAATALLPLAVLPLAGIATPAEAAAGFANDMVFLFLGGFMLGNAIERWGVHQRLARGVAGLMGNGHAALVGGMMATTAFVSLWISNTAAALLMMPVGLAVARRAGPKAENFRTAMALGIGLAASIGGMGTPIGSTPNLLLVNTMTQLYGQRLNFGWWMAWGVPLVAVLTALTWALLVWVLHPVKGGRMHVSENPPPNEVPSDSPETTESVLEQPQAANHWAFGEVLATAAFALAIAGWILREPRNYGGFTFGLAQYAPGLSDGTIAIAAALLLFLIPVSLKPLRFGLTWEEGGRIPWEVILLLGGGLSLAEGIQRTGFDALLAQSISGLGGVPTWVLVVAMAALCLVMSEVASNTATAALLLPVAGAISESSGAPLLLFMLPVTLAASLGFMMPQATPPNALTIATGHVSPAQMARAGAILNMLGLVLVLLACYGLAFPLAGLSP